MTAAPSRRSTHTGTVAEVRSVPHELEPGFAVARLFVFGIAVTPTALNKAERMEELAERINRANERERPMPTTEIQIDADLLHADTVVRWITKYRVRRIISINYPSVLEVHNAPVPYEKCASASDLIEQVVERNFPDDGRRDCINLLIDLGDTPEQVAETLIAANIRGSRRSQGTGPLEIYMANRLDLPVGAVVIEDDSIEVDEGEKSRRDRFRHSLPPAVAELQKCFEAGEFSELWNGKVWIRPGVAAVAR